MYEVMSEMFEISDGQNVYDLEVVAEMVMRLRAKHEVFPPSKWMMKKSAKTNGSIHSIDADVPAPSSGRDVLSIDGDGHDIQWTYPQAVLEVISDPDQLDQAPNGPNGRNGANYHEIPNPMEVPLDTDDLDDLNGENDETNELLQHLWSEFVAEH